MYLQVLIKAFDMAKEKHHTWNTLTLKMCQNNEQPESKARILVVNLLTITSVILAETYGLCCYWSTKSNLFAFYVLPVKFPCFLD